MKKSVTQIVKLLGLTMIIMPSSSNHIVLIRHAIGAHYLIRAMSKLVYTLTEPETN
jgi:hypothetical protein